MHDRISVLDLTMAMVVTTEIAVRLSKAVGSTPRFWIQLQDIYDAAQAEEMLDQIDIKRIERAA